MGTERTTFAALMTKWTWRPIRNCPGRYLMAGVPSDLPPQALVRSGDVILEFRVETAPDKVLVVQLVDGGVITYEWTDGRYVHTLNDPEGFSRKLRQLGIGLP
jgi:hypothetical protein